MLWDLELVRENNKTQLVCKNNKTQLKDLHWESDTCCLYFDDYGFNSKTFLWPPNLKMSIIMVKISHYFCHLVSQFLYQSKRLVYIFLNILHAYILYVLTYYMFMHLYMIFGCTWTDTCIQIVMCYMVVFW